VQAWLAQAVARRPVAFLAANLALAALLGAVALGASDRLAVGGGTERGGGSAETEVVIVLGADGPVRGAVAREAQRVVESGLLADPAVRAVEPLERAAGGDAIFVVAIAGETANARQVAAERVVERIDPGPFTVSAGGESVVQGAARDEVEDELASLAALAAPFVLLVLVLSFGLRLAIAPLIAAVTAALGAIAVLRAAPASLDLTAVGLAVAAAVGLAVAVEACLALRRAYADARFDAQEAMLEEAIGSALPRIAWGCAGGAHAAATYFAVPLPAAHSAAIGGIAAALIATPAALVATASVLALSPAEPPTAEDSSSLAERDRGRLTRIYGEIATRPALAWIPALLALAALGLATAPAFDIGARALVAADLGATAEPTRIADRLATVLPADEAEGLVSGTTADAAEAAELLRERLPWLLAAIAVAGLVAAYAATRSAGLALARGIGAALPAGATCGLLVLAAEGSLPFDLEPLGPDPHASALVAALAGLGAVGVARSAFADAGVALAGTLVAGAALVVLTGIELDAVAELGIALAAGLAIDFLLVRAVLAPCLQRALPDRFLR
jgi:hypothetical protein